ncbi:MAG: hypothetical protein KGV59_05365 [Tenacibaculum sp.]|nr:hypothetical protein [Tenacibaculum sp.]
MIANFFRKSKPINTVAIICVLLFYYSIAIVTNKIPFQPIAVFGVLLTLGSSQFIIIKNKLTKHNSYSFLLFVLLITFFVKTLTFTSSLYSNLILFLFLRKVYSLKKETKTIQKIFDASFWIGILFIIEPFLIIFITLLYFAIYLNEGLKIRTLLIPIIGFFIPVFLYFTYCFWFNKINDFCQLFYSFTDINWGLYLKNNYLISIIFTLIFILISIILKTPKIIQTKDSFNFSWLLLILNFILSALLIYFIDNKNGSEFIYIIFPSAIIIANGIELYQKKWISDIILLLFFIFSVVVNVL